MEDENKPNEAFKNKLFDHEEPVSDQVWKGIDEKLNKPDNRKRWIIWWLPVVGLLLVGAGLLFLNKGASESPNTLIRSEQSQTQGTDSRKSKPIIEDDEPLKRLAEQHAKSKQGENTQGKRELSEMETEEHAMAQKDEPEKTVSEVTTHKKKAIAGMLTSSTPGFGNEGNRDFYKKENQAIKPLGMTKAVSGRSIRSIQPKESGYSSGRSGQVIEQSASIQRASIESLIAEKNLIGESYEQSMSKSNVNGNESKQNGLSSFMIQKASQDVLPFLQIKMAEIQASTKQKGTKNPLSMQSVELILARTDSAPEKQKEGSYKKWHVGITAAALGAMQHVSVERNINEWNAASLPLLDGIKNSPVFEGSLFASYSFAPRMTVGANAGLHTWLETVNFQTLSGLQAEYTLEQITLPNAETSFQGNPINDQRFTQNQTTRHATFWFQPKLAFQPVQHWPLWLKPGYQAMLINLQNSNRSPQVNGPTFELCMQRRHFEFGLKCLFFRRQDQIQFVPKSNVNSFWLGATMGWGF